MASMAHGRAGHDCRCASNSPLVVDPAEPPSVETVLFVPGGKASAPVLIIPGGVRICVDASRPDIDAAEWWKDLAMAALYASLCYQGEESLTYETLSDQDRESYQSGSGSNGSGSAQ